MTLIISLTTVQGLKIAAKKTILRWVSKYKNRETGACPGVGPTGPWIEAGPRID